MIHPGTRSPAATELVVPGPVDRLCYGPVNSGVDLLNRSRLAPAQHHGKWNGGSLDDALHHKGDVDVTKHDATPPPPKHCVNLRGFGDRIRDALDEPGGEGDGGPLPAHPPQSLPRSGDIHFEQPDHVVLASAYHAYIEGRQSRQG